MVYLVGLIVVFLIVWVIRSGAHQTKVVNEFNLLSPEEQHEKEEVLKSQLLDFFTEKGDTVTVNDLYNGRYSYRQMMVLKKNYNIK